MIKINKNFNCLEAISEKNFDNQFQILILQFIITSGYDLFYSSEKCMGWFQNLSLRNKEAGVNPLIVWDAYMGIYEFFDSIRYFNKQKCSCLVHAQLILSLIFCAPVLLINHYIIVFFGNRTIQNKIKKMPIFYYNNSMETTMPECNNCLVEQVENDKITQLHCSNMQIYCLIQASFPPPMSISLDENKIIMSNLQQKNLAIFNNLIQKLEFIIFLYFNFLIISVIYVFIQLLLQKIWQNAYINLKIYFLKIAINKNIQKKEWHNTIVC
ncbi:unnamed protein product (macronuclear) [Paramecium tetraurelia]|uniref:Transmembrane protein n=1 Tax=Paramecium tetraurelia TaxID=5888 RepID=A0BCT2_PARTE|nr:uncharacterized protein GSPATT00004443001 [Paramecium tetraurelia]CAK56349.1 unnamed protein product [Paramecium tetraurelia]|eukprot:XP_001423747.1 hypothetical protein (macronuclear) [Paramecium tetraurelia strain d4-2]